MSRIAARFAALKREGRAGFVPYISAGDPSIEASRSLLKGLPRAGADLIELGMPFTDPMADGPAVQAAGLRALKAGGTMRVTLDLVRSFRADDAHTPLILMGYCNPVHAYGVARFAKDAAQAGADGVILVDLTPEESAETSAAFAAAKLDLIRLATPTTSANRLPAVLNGATGFLYYVSITGVTGTKDYDPEAVAADVRRLRASTDLPIGVGFGIKTPAHVKAIGKIADAAVVGSSIVARIAENLYDDSRLKPGLVEDVLGYVAALAAGVRA